VLPFTREQFIAVFAAYNTAVWPAQIVAGLVGLVMVAMLARPTTAGSRVIGIGLAVMWAWTGVGYHWIHFSAVNKAAWAFGALFVLQGIALFYAAVGGRLRFGIGRPSAGADVVGFVLERFSPGEERDLPAQIALACAAVETVFASGLAVAMDRFNGDPALARASDGS